MAGACYQKKYRKLMKDVNALMCDDEPLADLSLPQNTETDECSGTSLSIDTERDNSNCTSCTEPVTFDSDIPPFSSEDENDSSVEFVDISLRSELAKWVVDARISREDCNGLLSILRRHGHDLPKDRRTLLSTPKSVNVMDICGGQYVYFGLQKCLHAVACTTVRYDDLRVQINIDGVPLYSSSSTQLWPILCSVNGSQPMAVALFMGKAKPNSLEAFLGDFVAELADLVKGGFVCSQCEGNVNVPVLLHSVVCDAPARAFVKNIKGHNSLEACERCKAVGVSVNSRTTFTSQSCFEAEKRCSEDFNKGEYIGSHQHGPTPLTTVSEDCINICSLDYMHLICLGVVRRMMHFWRTGNKIVKLSSRHLMEISEKLVALRSYIPSEFARRPRSLLEMDRWKATELRQFLLYTGPVVLKSVLSPELYTHFLCLSISTSIMLTQDALRRNDMIAYARKLLRYFVANCERLYGSDFVVYNVHSLLHIADDVQYFESSLDSVSAFKYENYLQTIKRLIRGASNPIAQVTKRLHEYECVNSAAFTVNSTVAQRKLSCHERDSVVYLREGRFARIVKIDNDKLSCAVYLRHVLHPFYLKPCSSDIMDIFYVSKCSINRMPVVEIDRHEIQTKGLCLPHGDGFVLMVSFMKKIGLRCKTGILGIPGYVSRPKCHLLMTSIFYY